MPFARLAEVAQPAHRVFANSLGYVADRNYAPFAPVLQTVDRIVQRAAGDLNSERANCHVAGQQIACDALREGATWCAIAKCSDLYATAIEL